MLNLLMNAIRDTVFISRQNDFPCLVDADFIDTEEFMSEEKITRGVECNFLNLRIR